MIREYTADLKDFYKKVFDNSQELRDVLFSFGINEINGDLDKFFYKTIRIFLEDTDFNALFSQISSSRDIYEYEYNKSKDNFNYEKISPFYKIQKLILEGFDLFVPWNNPRFALIYIQLLFTFIYGSVKSYFFDNRKRFLPEYDWFLIENNEDKRIHIEGFFREFDRISDVLSYLADLKDIEDAPEDKLAYISAILGIKFDLEDDTVGYINNPQGFYRIELFSPSRIRTLLGNIVDIYRSKGTKYSYELFFNAIGIDASLKEMYFDRRLYWNSKKQKTEERINTETKVNDLTSFYYYLTSKNPSSTINNATPYEKVNKNSMTEPKSEIAFNYIIKGMNEAGYDIESVLGYGNKKTGETFTYFKTNILVIDFRYYIAGEEEETVLSPSHILLLENYLDLITPVYIKKYLPGTKALGITAVEGIDLYFGSGDGVFGFYEDGKYRETERSNGLTTGGTHFEENEFNSKIEDVNFEDENGTLNDTVQKNSINNEVPFIVNEEPLISGDVGALLSFENSSGYILNNIDFTWYPKTEEEVLEVGGSFVLDYFSYHNPVVAVGVQNIGEKSISISVSEK